MGKSRREPSEGMSRGPVKAQRTKGSDPKPHLEPLRPILLIDSSGSSEITPQSITPSNVGLKALGLASMPVEWVPPFFVVSASCFSSDLSDTRIQGLITEGVSINLKATGSVIVRSSGSSETARDRGQLVSKHCLPHQIAETIRDLIRALPPDVKTAVHWIVQQIIPTQQLGHLSNERHLRKENRDWIVEVETLKSRPGYTVPFAIRRWRDGMEATTLDLTCTSELDISRKLRRVAMWAMPFSTRLHFEWVWDGRRIWMVQAEAADIASGTNPASVVPEHLPQVDIATLRSFRLANEDDYKVYRKLRNAQLYSELGYKMPHFYVLDDPLQIKAILKGVLLDDLKSDLAELTKRALMLRTDGENIPEEKREMLPRSDVLSSAESANAWLLNDFKSKIDQRLKRQSLMLGRTSFHSFRSIRVGRR